MNSYVSHIYRTKFALTRKSKLIKEISSLQKKIKLGKLVSTDSFRISGYHEKIDRPRRMTWITIDTRTISALTKKGQRKNRGTDARPVPG